MMQRYTSGSVLTGLVNAKTKNDDSLLLKGHLDVMEEEIHQNASKIDNTASRIDINDMSAE